MYYSPKNLYSFLSFSISHIFKDDKFSKMFLIRFKSKLELNFNSLIFVELLSILIIGLIIFHSFIDYYFGRNDYSF